MVLTGQLAAGVGNLAFAALAARVLVPGAYADLTAFLALYLLLHLPAAAMSAAGAVAPDRLRALRPAVLMAGGAAGTALALASPVAAPALGLPVPMVIVLALAAPGAALLGLERGVAYGREHHRRITRSLVAEPAARLAIGVLLAALVGPMGAAIAVLLAGYLALAAVRLWSGEPSPAAADRLCEQFPRYARKTRTQTTGAGAAGATAAGFVLIAVLQMQDLLVANRALDAAAAGQYGVLSTLGGAAAFATATIPLVLLPAAAQGRRHAATAALGLTAAIGGAIAMGGAVLARPLVEIAFGDHYAPVARLVGPYLAAMALIGVVRVLVARRCAAQAGDRRLAVAAVTAAVAVELLAMSTVADSIEALVATTLATAAGLAGVLALPDVARAPAVRERSVTLATAIRRPEVIAVGGLCVVAAAVRLASTRGLWVDEAISVRQASLPFGEMLADMRTTDVHPPLHHAVLWVTVRLFGTSELAVRLPSLLAGVALVPVMYKAGAAVYDRRTGLIAAALATVAPFCVWYSQEARMYSLFMLFAALAVYAQVMAVRRGRSADWLLYAVASAAMLWTQYFAVLPIAVQQLGFVWVAWSRRRDRRALVGLVKGWAATTALIVLAVLPLTGIISAQFEAYSHRSDGLSAPSQAGAGSSTIGGTISIYAAGANLIWAVWGYHADGVMAQIAAVWPLGMLGGLLLLGRGRRGASVLLLALVVVPMAALFAVGSMKRDLFELRYFSGAVPVALLLGARLVSATTRRRGAVAVAGVLVVGTMAIGLVDQQLNGANPRRYDFAGALDRIEARAQPGDVLLYEPAYLGDVIDYYAPDLDARKLDAGYPSTGGTVWVLATDRVVNSTESAAKVGDVLARLEQTRALTDRFQRPNVQVWELQ